MTAPAATDSGTMLTLWRGGQNPCSSNAEDCRKAPPQSGSCRKPLPGCCCVPGHKTPIAKNKRDFICQSHQGQIRQGKALIHLWECPSFLLDFAVDAKKGKCLCIEALDAPVQLFGRHTYCYQPLGYSWEEL
jgi:hypothetical protein